MFHRQSVVQQTKEDKKTFITYYGKSFYHKKRICPIKSLLSLMFSGVGKVIFDKPKQQCRIAGNICC
jgi:hypothetical protein